MKNPNRFSFEEVTINNVKILGIENSQGRDKKLKCEYILLHSSKFGLYNVVSKLKKDNPNIDPNIAPFGLTALYMAACNGHVEVVKELLKFPRINPTKRFEYRQPLHRTPLQKINSIICNYRYYEQQIQLNMSFFRLAPLPNYVAIKEILEQKINELNPLRARIKGCALSLMGRGPRRL